MPAHRYEPVHTQRDDDDERYSYDQTQPIPSSPPPSFHSRTPSPISAPILSEDPLHSEADRALEDTFGGADQDSDDEDVDDRQRLMRGSPNTSNTPQSPSSPTHSGVPTPLPGANASASTPSRIIRGNDGVFANMAAKPEAGEKLEDLPPTYEQAAADATPPYWETTIVAPGMSSDEVYVDGLPVGSFFSFVWNGMISTSFQLVGFLLTYLLHTTHAAKNGSRAGLGLTLVQYGFYMKGSSDFKSPEPDDPNAGYGSPSNPNNHDFKPGSVDTGDTAPASGLSGISTNEWISYILMVVGWFILIRAISDYLRARRHEQLVLQSPDRGLPIPIIAENERTETVV
ncbi:hypothetical protein FQN57_000410 [Myotisia sp. PD_48]|nr:hypothetical protein FQN57_000410 [Myotisia sp. PD_48]